MSSYSISCNFHLQILLCLLLIYDVTALLSTYANSGNDSAIFSAVPTCFCSSVTLGYIFSTEIDLPATIEVKYFYIYHFWKLIRLSSKQWVNEFHWARVMYFLCFIVLYRVWNLQMRSVFNSRCYLPRNYLFILCIFNYNKFQV